MTKPTVQQFPEVHVCYYAGISYYFMFEKKKTINKLKYRSK